jgi:acetylornithine/succinyldiaminopimelate/putrescine aminotransferase
VADSTCAGIFELGDHGSTFAGGPVIAAAANVVLDTIDDEEFLADVRERGEQLMDGLRTMRLEPRGLGLMVGMHVPRAPELARRLLLEQRLVVNATGPDTIRLLPPLTVSGGEIDEALSRIGALLASPAA